MNPIILELLKPWYGNQSQKENSEFKPIKLCLKNTLLHPAHADGLVLIYKNVIIIDQKV